MSLARDHLYEFADFRLDAASRRLLRAGQIVPLTPKVFDLLLALVERRDRIVSKDELLKAVWPDTFVEEGNLTQNMSVLRKALDSGKGEEFIETLPRQGYRFLASVGEIGPPGEETHVVITEEPGNARFRVALLSALFLLVIAGGGTWFWLARRPRIPARPAFDSIVVLPFVNLSPDKENEYFSDGLTEELINSLAAIDGLRVAARTTAFQFKGKAQDIRTIGKQLGVAAVLEGSVRKEGHKLRVTAQLNSATDGYHFWSETYDRELKDVFAIQQDIAQAIQPNVRRSLGKLSPPNMRRSRPSVEAYDLYLKGRFHRSRVYGKSMDKAIELFEQAIRLQPDYAEAYAALANCYTDLGYSGQLPPKEAFPKAVAPLRKALALDDSLAEAHTQQAILSLLFDWDWKAARREFQRAITLDPASSFARHWYSHYLTAMRDFDGSLAESKRALEIDPLDLNVTSHLAWHYDFARDYGQAITAAGKSLEIDPNHAPSLEFLRWAYEGAGRFDPAIDIFEKQHLGSWVGPLRRAVRDSGAAGYWRTCAGLAKQQRANDSYRMAEFYAHLGDASQTMDWLNRAFEQRHSWLIYLNSDPAFDAVREDPRFIAMVKDVGLPQLPEK